MPVLFVVAPSANIRNGDNFPDFSISSYLSLIYDSASFLVSSHPPLLMYIESIAYIKFEKIGTFLKWMLGANAGFICFINTTGSSQLEWLLIIVEVCLVLD